MSAWNALLPESSVTLCQSFRYLLKPSPQRSLPASPCLKEMCMHVCTHTHIHTTQSLFIFSHKTYHCLTLCVCVLVAQLCLTVTPWTVAHQAPLSVGILQTRILSGLPLPSPGDLSNSGIEHRSPAFSLPSEPPGKPL